MQIWFLAVVFVMEIIISIIVEWFFYSKCFLFIILILELPCVILRQAYDVWW